MESKYFIKCYQSTSNNFFFIIFTLNKYKKNKLIQNYSRNLSKLNVHTNFLSLRLSFLVMLLGWVMDGLDCFTLFCVCDGEVRLRASGHNKQA